MKRWMMVLALLGASCGKDEPAAKPSGMNAGPAASPDRAKDVVCGMMVDKATAKKETFEGAPYYFCGDECVKKFKAEPKKFSAPCSCGKSSAKCLCEHCGHHKKTPCDCGT